MIYFIFSAPNIFIHICQHKTCRQLPANLVRQGISAVCMASAMYDCHKTTEFTREDDMVRAAQLLESILHTR